MQQPPVWASKFLIHLEKNNTALDKMSASPARLVPPHARALTRKIRASV